MINRQKFLGYLLAPKQFSSLLKIRQQSGDPEREDGEGPLAMYLTGQLRRVKPDDLVVGSICLSDTAVPSRFQNWDVMGQKYNQLLPQASSIGKVARGSLSGD